MKDRAWRLQNLRQHNNDFFWWGHAAVTYLSFNMHREFQHRWWHHFLSLLHDLPIELRMRRLRWQRSPNSASQELYRVLKLTYCRGIWQLARLHDTNYFKPKFEFWISLVVRATVESVHTLQCSKPDKVWLCVCSLAETTVTSDGIKFHAYDPMIKSWGVSQFQLRSGFSFSFMTYLTKVDSFPFFDRLF